MEISFLPRRISSLMLSVLMSSVLTIMNEGHVYRCLLKHMQWNNELEEVLLLGSTIVLLTLCN